VPRQRQEPDAEDDPLIAPAAFAKLLDHADTTTISQWLSGKRSQPPGWPEPDQWIELPTRRRPMWRLSRAKAFAATERRPGPPPGQYTGPTRYRQPSVTNPRAVEIAAWLAAADAGQREPVTRHEIEKHFAVPDYTARHLLNRARTYREDQDRREDQP